MLITTFFTPQLFQCHHWASSGHSKVPASTQANSWGEGGSHIVRKGATVFLWSLFETTYLFPGGPRENGLRLGDFGHRCTKGRVCERTKKTKMTFICKAKFEELWEVKDSSFKRRFDANITSWVEMWTSSLIDIWSKWILMQILSCVLTKRENIFPLWKFWSPFFIHPVAFPQ